MIRHILRDGRDLERGAGSGPDGHGEGHATLHAVKRPPIPWLDPPPGPWNVERAYGYCEEFVRAHTESFPVASRFEPAPRWEVDDFFPRVSAWQRSYFAFHEWIGCAWYALRQWMHSSND